MNPLQAPLIDLHQMRDDEWEFAVHLMRVNMQPYYERYRIAWDLEWIETEYKPRSNWTATQNGMPVGFVSCEVLGDRLHVHTFQLVKRVQGRRVGLNVLRRMEAEVFEPGVSKLTCSVFKDHLARSMYVRMGFVEVGMKGNLVSLELPLVEGRIVMRRPIPQSRGPLD